MSPEFSAPYMPPTHNPFRPSSAPPGAAGVGVVAMIVAIVATAAAAVIAVIAAYAIGSGVGAAAVSQTLADFRLGQLSPVSGWVLTVEVAFWAGTLVGLWGLVQGVTAIATDRGRVQGIVAVAVAVLGPILFVAAGTIAFTIGVGSAFAAVAY